MLSLVIFGSRSLSPTIDEIDDALRARFLWTFRELICGMADGTDLAGKIWAEHRGLPVVKMPADWDAHGKGAGPIRNEAMARRADVGLGFWDGTSTGTINMAGWMACLDKPLEIVRV